VIPTLLRGDHHVGEHRDEGIKRLVPKRDLIGAAQVALQQRRVKLPRMSSEAKNLVEELLAYRYNLDQR